MGYVFSCFMIGEDERGRGRVVVKDFLIVIIFFIGYVFWREGSFVY